MGVKYYLLGCFSNGSGPNLAVCVRRSRQIGVAAAMTLAEFIMRVSLLLSVGKQACG